MSLRTARAAFATLLPALFLSAASARAQAVGQLEASPTLFAVLAAINAAGYNADLNSPSNSPLRAELRRAIEARHPASLPALREFYQAHRKPDAAADIGQYISFALSVTPPPEFKPRYDRVKMPPEARSLDGLSELLQRFWNEAGLPALWQGAQGAHETVIARYQRPLIEALQEVNLYLRIPSGGYAGRRFQIYFDLLGAPNQVHARSFADDQFVVITASSELRVADIRRAYIHYTLDPLVIRYAANLEKKKGLADFALASPILDEAYKNDFVLLTSMSLAKAVEARLLRGAGPAFAGQAMREGFILTAYFAEALPAYEKQEQAMRLYLPGMLDGIDVAKEDRRIAKVDFVSRRETRRVAPPAPVAPAKSALESEIEAAEKAFEQRQLEPARAGFRKALLAEAPKPLHARAYYGLARLAVLDKQPDLAEKLFERTLELDPDSFVQGWAHVYLARLAQEIRKTHLADGRADDAAREAQRATGHYRAALAVEGLSTGARRAAEQGLEQLAAAKN